eukprot:6208556-Pleurochrysis_carterae.AAC.1
MADVQTSERVRANVVARSLSRTCFFVLRLAGRLKLEHSGFGAGICAGRGGGGGGHQARLFSLRRCEALHAVPRRVPKRVHVQRGAGSRCRHDGRTGLTLCKHASVR